MKIDYSVYLCTESDINLKYDIDSCVDQAICGGVTFVQIREKNKSKDEVLVIAKKVKKVTDKYNIPLVINDYIDIAMQVDAAGVHLGQDDMACIEARKLLGPNKIIGISVHNVEEAKKAIDDGADYLGVGAIYPSMTKKEAVVVGSDVLGDICKISEVPIVVIGGINKESIPNLKGKNISGYAMIRPILNAEDIQQNTKELKKIILRNNVKI